MKLERSGISVEEVDGRLRIEREGGGFLTLDADAARWLAIVALPAMLPGITTAAQQRDERLGNGG